MSYAAIGDADEFDFCPDAIWNVIDRNDNVWCADECPPGWDRDPGVGPEDAGYCLEPYAPIPALPPSAVTRPTTAEATARPSMLAVLALGAAAASVYYIWS
jgi:hypothetical protein